MVEINGTIIKESEKAILFEIILPCAGIQNTRELWIPKSILNTYDSNAGFGIIYQVPFWFAKKNGLI